MERKHIEELVEKYFNGDTSNSEEQALRCFFAGAGNDIPDEWKALKALFAYETAERNNSKEERKPLGKTPKTTVMRRYIRYAAVAAAVILITIPVMMHRHNATGNYAVIDGKVCTDSRTVAEEAEKALMMVASGESETFEALGEIQ